MSDIDFTAEVRDGPGSLGFDHSYIIPASLDFPPYVYIENDRVDGIPTVEKAFPRLGPAHEDFEAVDVLPTLTAKATAYIDEQSKTENQS